MRITRTARVNLDLFLGVPAGVPAGLYPELRKHGIGATDVVVARVVVFGPSILQLDNVVGVYRHRAEAVAGGNAEPHRQEVGQIQNARKNNGDDKNAFHEPDSNAPPYCELSLIHIFSAKKIKGVPAYRLARKKQPVELEPVEVEVKEFTVLGLAGDLVDFRCRVSSGTYVRSLGHELGQKLGIGAHLASLRRTQVAEFAIEESHTLEEIGEAAAQGRIPELLVHPRRVLPEIPSVTATDEDIAKIRHGRTVNLPEMSRSRFVKVFAGQSELICIASRVAGTLFHPKVVLCC